MVVYGMTDVLNENLSWLTMLAETVQICQGNEDHTEGKSNMDIATKLPLYIVVLCP